MSLPFSLAVIEAELFVLLVAEVVTKYSNFVSFPIFLNGRRLNTLQVSFFSSLYSFFFFLAPSFHPFFSLST